MLKRLAIIGVLLSLAIPAMAKNDQPVGHRDPNQRQQNAQHPPSPAIAPVTNNYTTAYYQEDSKDKPRGWHKFIAWPDGITAWLLMLTLCAIVWQSWETRGSAKAGWANVQLMMSKERARLRIELEDFNMNPEAGRFTLPYNIVLTGTTQAETLSFDFFAAIAATPPVPTQPKQSWVTTMGNPLPKVIAPADKTVRREHSVFTSDDDLTQKGANNDAILIRGGKMDVYCYGSILYEDIFGGRWRRNFSRRWTYDTLPGQLGGQGKWLDYGGPEANSEEKAN
jgi:hypothetical protein